MAEDFGPIPVAADVVVWRLVTLETVERLEKASHGTFDDSYTYLVLRIIGSFPEAFDIFFWLGAESTPDRHCVAAMKAAELDGFIGGKATIHRESQGFESADFLSIFKGQLIYESGNAQKLLKHVGENEQKRLYHIKGTKRCRISEVPVAFESINRDDVFVLDTPKTVYVFIGPGSNIGERHRGTEFGRFIRDNEKAGKANIDFIESDWDSNAEFYAHLGVEPCAPPQRPELSDEDAEDWSRAKQLLFRVSDESGTLLMEPVDGPLTEASLDSRDCFVLDTASPTSGIFVWIGRLCSDNERRGVWDNALKYLRFMQLPESTPITKVVDGHETALFRSMLRLPGNLPGLKQQIVKPRTPSIASSSSVSIDLDFKAPHQAPEGVANFDDGDGTKKVWRVAKFDLSPVPQEHYGVFYDSYAYIVQYTSLNQRNLLYFWCGSHSSRDSQAAAAMLARQLNQNNCRNAGQEIRIEQFKEPNHFLRIFGDAVVYLRGSLRSEDEYVPDERQLFQISGRRIAQVDFSARNLNSNDIFFVRLGTNRGLIWIGKGANIEEHETVGRLPFLFNVDQLRTFAEENEPDEFWNLLGGKCAYHSSEPLCNPHAVPRLFHCSNAAGKFGVEEIYNFSQADLETSDVMMLDALDAIYVWLGKESNAVEQKTVLDVALKYIARSAQEGAPKPKQVVVKQGSEPPEFKAFFGAWDDRLWDGRLTYTQLRQQIAAEESTASHSDEDEPLPPAEVVVQTIEEVKAQYSQTHPLSALLVAAENLPPGVHPARKEDHLSDEDFLQVFGMERNIFKGLPKWRQDAYKKMHDLF